ncbi:Lrp/AsnC family transcriptional regulator [Amycolatopsis balhimycina]|uniref:Lrp/AsnC family transcriptional regulator n=1 Tax=Amycolatopsis balhimycina TaxID=208443 RepID=UPI0003A18597|nr:Lrp/AsnC family transcriptional regulator [Amycolatopsis balhimycina]
MIVRQLLDETDRRIAAALLAVPLASWREVATALSLSERTVVRRAGPLLHAGTIRVTAVRNPRCFPGLVPLALRIRCRPRQILTVAAALARRPDTVWVDLLGGGDELSTVLFLDGPEARNTLLLRDLPATKAVDSWTAHTLLQASPVPFGWTGGLLTAAEADALGRRPLTAMPTALAPDSVDNALIQALTANGRASYIELGRQAGITPLVARRRSDRLVGHAVRLVAEVDLALLGIGCEALLWIQVAPGALRRTASKLSNHPRVRFAAVTTGPANLLVAVAAEDLDALYELLTDSLDAVKSVSAIETTPILRTFKRAGLLRPA